MRRTMPPSGDAAAPGGPALAPAPSRPRGPRWRAAASGACLALTLLAATAQTAPPAATAAPAAGPLLAAPSAIDSTVVDARDALRKRDRSRLAAARATLLAANHPLAMWADYWELSSRLPDATADEVDAFFARWAGSYVEDRLRNDWLLELGRRRDLARLARELPRFRMNDDREVTCWGLLTDHLAGRDVTDAARTAWLAQRDSDDGCHQLASALVDAKRFGADDVWRKARVALEGQRPGAAKLAIGLLAPQHPGIAKDAAEALDNPARFLRRSGGITRTAHELRLLAVMRLAATDLDAAVQQLDSPALALPKAQAAAGWAYVARQSAFKLLPEAAGQVQRGWQLLPAAEAGKPLPAAAAISDETLAWGLRALLRSPPSPSRWAAVARQIDAMSVTEQRDPAWQYWKAQALKAGAADLATQGDAAGADAARAESRRLFEAVAGAQALGFYPNLASDELGNKPALPAAPAPISAAEREAALRTPGLQRALQLVALGLRDEGRREWNFTLRGMADRELNAAARLACEASDWQLCINTADRTRSEVDLALRYPTPYAAEITQAAREAGLEPGFVFGLIRQETRFMGQLRSGVGATGLMQVMPATGRWVAKKVGLDPARAEGNLADNATNLLLGTRYLKLVLDDLGGNQAMAAAAYNAGPGRPRRWREGGVVEAAAWTESIPFAETRDYVKKVLSNSAVYGAMLDARKAPAVRPRLGERIGPRDGAAPPPNPDLP
jgi:soluble lytic murein transglycosylase